MEDYQVLVVGGSMTDSSMSATTGIHLLADSE